MRLRLEAKRALPKIFNEMGKPKVIKAYKDSAFMCSALQIWLKAEGVDINITTSKNGTSDFERLHQNINEKLIVINSEYYPENKLTRFEIILYTYNHKTTHNPIGRTPADIFIHAGTPEYNIKLNKTTQIDKLNEKRTDFQIDTNYLWYVQNQLIN